MNNLELTVEDVLQRDHFKNAKVIAGNKGLKKQVKWTHILETNKFDSLINGGELILTTGAGLRLDSTADLTYVQNLIKRKTVGICVEIGTHVDRISNEIIDLANKYHFPVIIFNQVVKFVDITQDLHSQIINQHHYMINLLNELSAKFNELSLLPNGILKILQEMHTYFNKSALFIMNEARSYYYPPEIKYKEEQIRSRLFDNGDINNKQGNVISIGSENFAFAPVKGLGQTWGYLCLQVKDDVLNKFYFSVMDRAALAIAQIMLRNRTIEERKQNREDKLVRNLLHGKDYDSDEIQTILPHFAKNLSYRLVLIQTNLAESNHEEEDWNEVKLQQSVMFRALCKQYGFFPAISVGKNDTAIIAFFTTRDDRTTTSTEKFSEFIKTITDINEKSIFSGDTCTFGVSKVNDCIRNVTESYQEAKKVLSLQSATRVTSIFYEHIGIYRLLLSESNIGQLSPYIYDYLSPLLNYDYKAKSELLKTLEIYLDCGGSKKETADQLFIVRQTLYHRLRKIQELLGEDFMEPGKRLALEAAIKAYYLSKATL